MQSQWVVWDTPALTVPGPDSAAPSSPHSHLSLGVPTRWLPQQRRLRSYLSHTRTTLCLLLRPGTGAEYCNQFVCLSVCVSVREHISGTAGPIFTNFLCRSPVAVARSSPGGVAIRYVLPVLWMTSRLAVVGRMATSGVAIPGRSLMSMNSLFSIGLVLFFRSYPTCPPVCSVFFRLSDFMWFFWFCLLLIPLRWWNKDYYYC